MDKKVEKFREGYCMRWMLNFLYDQIYENPSKCVEVRNLFEYYKELCEKNGVDVDINVTRFKKRLEESLCENLKIIKSGKQLYVGWGKEIKDAAISAMKSNIQSFSQKMSSVAGTLRTKLEISTSLILILSLTENVKKIQCQNNY